MTKFELIKNCYQAFSIHFCGRSGSFLLQSLFDHHPQILSIPPFNINPLIPELENLAKCYNETKDTIRLVTDITESFAPLFKQYNEMGSTYYHGCAYAFGMGSMVGITIHEFRKYFLEGIKYYENQYAVLDFSGLLKIIYLSYNILAGKKFSTKPLILLLQLHQVDPVVMKKCQHSFENYHALITVRSPVQSLDSQLYHHIYEEKCSIDHLTHHLVRLYMESTIKKENLNTLAIKFEDVHCKTEKTMKALCKLLDIDWHPCLLRSTIDGKIFWWRHGKTLRVGTNPKIQSSKKLKLFSKRDALKIQFLMYQHCKQWNYPKLPLKLFFRILLLFPFKTTFLNLDVNFKKVSKKERIKIIYREIRKFRCLYRRNRKASIIPSLLVDSSH